MMRLLSATLILGFVVGFGPQTEAKTSKAEVRKRAVATLASGARSGDFGTRAMAIEGLGHASKKDALVLVKEALEDPQWQVRRSTIAALLDLGQRALVEKALVDAMKTEKLSPREEVLPLMVPLGTKTAVKVISKAFRDKKFPRHERYADALAELGGPLMVGGYEAGLKLKDPEARESFEKKVATLPLPDALALYDKVLAKRPVAVQKQVLERVLADQSIGKSSFLTKLVKSRDPAVQLRAAAALAHRGDKRGQKTLTKAVQGSDTADRIIAAAALVNIATAKHLDIVKPIAKEADVDIALLKSVYEINAKVGNPKLARHLDARLESLNIQWRAAAVGVLGRIKGRSALPQLHHLLKDGAVAVRRAAAQSVADLAKPESISAIEGALSVEEDPEATIYLIQALARIRTPETVHVVQTKTDSSNTEEVRIAAVKALVAVRHEDAVPILKLSLRDYSDTVKQIALTALLDMGPARHVDAFLAALPWVSPGDLDQLVGRHGKAMLPHLKAALKSSRDELRDAAFRGLKHIPKDVRTAIYKDLALKGKRTALRVLGINGYVDSMGRSAGGVLTKLIGDRTDEVRVAAILATGRVRSKGSTDLLMKLTDAPVERVRVAAAAALLQL